MFFPCFPVRRRIQHDRLDIIHGSCESGFRCLPLFKFLPKFSQTLPLILRQKSENAVCSFLLSFTLSRLRRFVIGIGIPGINLHDIMDQKHGNCFQYIDRFIGVFTEENRHQRHVPCMLCVIFLSGSPCEVGLTADELFFVNFTDKIELLIQAGLFRVGRGGFFGIHKGNSFLLGVGHSKGALSGYFLMIERASRT